MRTTRGNWRILRQQEDRTIRQLLGTAIMRMLIAGGIDLDKMMHTVRAGDSKKSQKSQHHAECAQAPAGPLAPTKAGEGAWSEARHKGP